MCSCILSATFDNRLIPRQKRQFQRKDRALARPFAVRRHRPADAGLYVDQIHLSRVEPAKYQDHLVGEAAGFFNIVHPLLPALRETGGAVVAVTTMATRRYPIKDGLSSSPKGAVEALVRALAVEEGRFGVRLNCVGPGVLSDGMAARFMETGEMDERAAHVALSRIPLGRCGNAIDIAEMAAGRGGNGEVLTHRL